MKNLGFILLFFILTAVPKPQQSPITIPTIDISNEKERQIIVDKEPGQYLGHVTTVLLEDGKTIIAVYPKGHGRGAIVMKISRDGGLTWSRRLPVPENWKTSKEVPTIYKTIDQFGKRRLILFSGLFPIRMAYSEDDGVTWTKLKPIGDFGGVVAMASCIPLKIKGSYMAFFHDDGRFISNERRVKKFKVYSVLSKDGGLSWTKPRVIAEHPKAHICEPGAVRSPDGNEIALLMRENSRRYNSFVIFSNDEGKTWTKPRQLPGSLTGDRHTLKYAKDGRLIAVFRDTNKKSKTLGDWVGWVGTYEDIKNNKEGQYRIRIMDNKHSWDCCYPGLEVLADGTIVTTTYGHWEQKQKPYIVCVRFRLEELDKRIKLIK